MVSVSDLLVLVVQHTANMSLNVSLAGAELDRMRTKYESDRASRGIPSDGGRTLRWMAYADARAGRRLQAARRGLSLARHQRSFTPLRSAFLALLGPTAIQIRQDHRSRHIPPHSLAEAEALVEEIKDLSLCPGLSRD